MSYSIFKLKKRIRLNCLKKGDIIGLISPSSPLVGLASYRVEKGIEMLVSMGFKVKVGKNALLVDDHVASDSEKRAEDIHDFFKILKFQQ